MASYNRGDKSSRKKPWKAEIRINGKKVFLGSFYTREQAQEREREAREEVNNARTD